MNFNLAEVSIYKDRSERVQLAKTGTFQHEEYGEFSITLYDLYRMKQLFESDVRKQQLAGKPVLPFDYRHATTEEAAGWIDSLSIEPDSDGGFNMFCSSDWTPRAAGKIRDKEFQFVSPDIRRNYKDKETGQVYDVVLMGAALTNVPFLRDMEAVFLLSEEKQQHFMSKYLSGDDPGKKLNQGVIMTFEELVAAIGQASPEERRKLFEGLAKDMESGLMNDNQQLTEKLKTSVTDLEKAKTDLEKSKSDLKLAEEKIKLNKGGDSEMVTKLQLSEQKVEKLSTKVESLVKTLAKNEKESEFNVMLSEGKVCEAQREPFMKNDFAEFADKAEPIKLDEKGTGNSDDLDHSDVQEKIEKLAEKKMKDEDTLEYGEAVSMVLQENPALSKQYQG